MAGENPEHIIGIEAVNPWRCRMWELHDRNAELLSPERCKGLIGSMERIGQAVPVLGRRLKGVSGFDFELIYGARRLYAAQHLNTPLRLAVTEVNDLEAVRLTFAENAHRLDLSPYERGTALKRLLREGHFRTQSELALALGISKATVSRLLSFSAIPAVVLSAFPDVTEVREEWALTLARLCREAACRQRIMAKARRLAIGEADRSAPSVYRMLIGDETTGAKAISSRDNVYKDRNGRRIFRVRRTQRKTSLVFEAGDVPQSQIDALAELARDAIANWREQEAMRLRDPALTDAMEKRVIDAA